MARPVGHQEGYPDTFRQRFVSVHAFIAAGDLGAPRDFHILADGHRELLHCDTLPESSRTGRWVDLPG